MNSLLIGVNGHTVQIVLPLNHRGGSAMSYEYDKMMPATIDEVEPLMVKHEYHWVETLHLVDRHGQITGDTLDIFREDSSVRI